MARRLSSQLGTAAGVAAVYSALAVLSLRVVLVAGQVSPVWPPTGAALFLVSLLGRRALPGVWMGSLLSTLGTGAPWSTACLVATGNMLEQVVAAVLLRRGGFDPGLARMRDVGVLVWASVCGSALSALVGSTAVCLAGLAPWELLPRAMGVWWVGNGMGALVVAPPLFAARTIPWGRLTPREVDERALLVVLLAAACAVVFGQPRASVPGISAQAFLLFPFAIWAALRLRAPEAALVTLVIATGATVGTALGLGPFATRPPLHGVLVLQLFIAVLALTTLLLNAARLQGLAASSQLTLLAAAVRSTEEGVLLLHAVPGRRPSVLFANRGFCEMAGQGEAALQGGGLAQLFGPEGAEDLHGRLERAVREGGSVSGESPLRRGDGTTFLAELQLSPVLVGPGEPPHAVLTVRDISRRHRMQSQLALAERMASVGRLAAGVAHEVNNPLAYLLTHLEALHRQLSRPPLAGLPETPGLRESVARAKEGGERVRNIVRDLRIFAREGREERERVEPNAAVETALTLTRNELAHRARVVRRLGDVPAVQANRARLEQVLVNLLVNAAHSIPEGAADAHEVEVRTGRDAAGRAEVVVRDTGRGIPSDVLPRVFEPFFTTKPAGEGTGLGLAICHEIVTGLGGDISVESAPGRGTTVRVALPAAPPELAGTSSRAGEAPLASAPASPWSGRAPAAPPPVVVPPLGAAGQRALPADPAGPVPESPAMERRSVLVIDDEVRMGLSIKLLLQPDHDVTTTTSAQEALDWLAAGRRFDVILCDLQMPVMSGMELYARLRESAPETAGRMLFLTGGAFTTAAREFVRTVPNRVLEKPVPPDVLLAAIAAAPLAPRPAA